MSKIKQIWASLKPKLKSKKFIFSAIIVLLIIFMISRNGAEKNSEVYEVKRGEFVKSVSVSGKVIAIESVELAFETSGRVARVNRKVGDKVSRGEVIVALNSSELQAAREKAQADVLAEEAELSKLISTENDDTEVANDRRLVINALMDAYAKADDAIRGKVDQFFNNPRTLTPEIKYSFRRYSETKDQINSGRKNIELMLKDWQKEVTSLTPNYEYKQSDIDKAFKNLTTINRFLDDVSLAVNSFESDDSLSEATIDKYKNDVATARTNISNSISNLTSVSEDLRSSVSQIPVQEARVKAAQADVRSLDAQIAETLITAPFSGTVSVQDAKMGESVAANVNMVSLISDHYQIEVYVPEVNITGVAVSNPVEVDLDAKPGEVDFIGRVTHVDPAETEKDGVANYKVKVSPDKLDADVRPGMTVDVRIQTGTRQDVIAIPERATIKESGKVYVDILGGKEPVRREITTGERDGRGNIEVLSGLSSGEKISLNPVATQ